ncbi:hypothetical protein C8Q80DRAFT_1133858 [Daedaleopsis nitida]|nr:hypothetical protein C8Q80DRAFT_1133858 [Daedaleopsis nitida]
MLLSRRRLTILVSLAFCAILICLSPLYHLFRQLVVNFPYPKRLNTSVLVESSRSHVSPDQHRLLHLPSPKNASLDMFSHIFVVSRPTRLDRRSTMEQLRATLDLEWTFVDAMSSEDPIVKKLQNCVRLNRKHTPGRQFHWPSDAEFGSVLSSTYPPKESLPWQSIPTPCTYPAPTARNLYNTSSPSNAAEVQLSTTTFLRSRAMLPPTPLTCAVQDRTHGVKYKSSLPSYMLLTPPKLACWYSHLDTILRFAHERPGLGEAALILEDDVDMERDIDARLQDVWQILPADWDILFLGHCWSNESRYPALRDRGSKTSGRYPKMAVHPSFAPKCTHAYALSASGARKLLLHLLYPPFSYSRALDQAYAWLVQSGRLRAFSVVPSVVIQHKLSQSDIDGGAYGLGSDWKEELEHGLLTV